MMFTLASSAQFTTDFNANLAGLGLGVSTTGDVNLSVGYTLNLGFELSKTEGFSVIVQPGNVFSFQVAASLGSNARLQGKLFFLNVLATNETVTDGGVGTQLSGSLNVSLLPSGSTDSEDLSLDEFLSQIASAQISANLAADINLLLTADVDPTLPSISTDLVVHFPIVGSGSGDIADDVSSPTVELENMTLNFGSFVDKLLGPAVDDISSVLAPITPILNFLNGDVPGISNITELAGLGPVTWADLLETVAAYAGADIDFSAFNNAIEVLGEVAGFASDIEGLSASGGINFGNFDLSSSIDVRQAGSVSNTSLGDLGTDSMSDQQLQSEVADENSGDSAAWDALSSDPGSLSFPVFDNPSSLVGLLLGKTVDLVQWTLPRVNFDLNFPAIPLAVIPIFGIVQADVDLIGNFDIQLGGDTIGFDTGGLTSGNFADGFYFENQPLISLQAGIGVGASVFLGISGFLGVGVGIGGELEGQVDVSLEDPSGAAKVYFDQLQSNCAVQLSGAFSAQVVAYLTESYIFGSSTQYLDITPPITLFSFSTSCTPYQLAHFSGSTLIVNLGPQGGDTVNVTQIAPGEMQVVGYGETQDYGAGVPGEPAVTGIYAQGGSGSKIANDITIDQSVTVPTTLIGAGGTDQIQGGSGANTIEGQGGDDVLEGFNGNDSITYSGGGTCSIVDGNGNDKITIVGGGSNYIQVGNGSDTIQGGAGNDTIYTGTGNDNITAGTGSGSNQVYGGGGNDTITATGAGAYLIEGGSGSNTIVVTGAGPGVIYGSGPYPGDLNGSGSSATSRRPGETTRSLSWAVPATTRSTVAAATTRSTAAPAMKRFTAARRATPSMPVRRATTRSSAAGATIRFMVAAATTPSTPTMATIRSTAVPETGLSTAARAIRSSTATTWRPGTAAMGRSMPAAATTSSIAANRRLACKSSATAAAPRLRAAPIPTLFMPGAPATAWSTAAAAAT